MKYLLDTSIFIWSLGAVEKLNNQALDLLTDRKQELYLSSASAWEITIKAASGKLKFSEPPARLIPKSLQAYGLRTLAITLHHAIAVGDLPMHHNDPFDRILIAQARSEGMILMTADSFFSKYSVQTLWCAT